MCAVVLSLTCPSLSLVIFILLMLSADRDPSNPAIRAQTALRSFSQLSATLYISTVVGESLKYLHLFKKSDWIIKYKPITQLIHPAECEFNALVPESKCKLISSCLANKKLIWQIMWPSSHYQSRFKAHPCLMKMSLLRRCSFEAQGSFNHCINFV